MFAKIIKFIISPWTKYQERKRWKKRLAELKKQDPFIYE
tara:strand:+ start:7846 stop:7962 length:117 start_codon:yes stop_codon:yes gene_type:complete